MKHLWPLFIFVAGCASLPKADLEKSLFPTGTYRQTVDVSPAGGRGTYRLSGVAGLTPEGLKIYMLGPMDVTAIKMSENFADGNVRIENSFEPLKPYEGRLKLFYPILRAFLLYPRDQASWGGLAVLARDQDGRIDSFKAPYGITIHILQYSKDHPSRFEFRHEKFRAQISEVGT